MSERIATLLRAYQERDNISDDLSSTFFPSVTMLDKETIEADVLQWGAHLARWTDVAGGVNVTSLDGFTTTTYRTREISESIPAGERAFTQLAPGQDEYTSDVLAQDLIISETLANSITKRLEMIAIQILFKGQVLGNDNTEVLHDFDRDVSLTKNVDFSDANNPIKIINDVVATMATKYYLPTSRIVVLAGSKAYQKLSYNKEVRTRLNSRAGVKYGLAEIKETIKPMGNVQIAEYIPCWDGWLNGSLPILTYEGGIHEKNVYTPYIPENEIIVTSLDAKRHRFFAPVAIAVDWNVLQPVEGKAAINTYVDSDTRTAYNQIYSRPFYIPENINNVAVLTVA